MSSGTEHTKDESLEAGASRSRTDSAAGEPGDAGEPGEAADAASAGSAAEEPRDDAQHLVKLSYHDSGIDIRDPVLHVTPSNAKKVSLKSSSSNIYRCRQMLNNIYYAFHCCDPVSINQI